MVDCKSVINVAVSMVNAGRLNSVRSFMRTSGGACAATCYEKKLLEFMNTRNLLCDIQLTSAKKIARANTANKIAIDLIFLRC